MLAPHMGTNATTDALITAVRAQNLGALIGSTPAIMDVPSLDPPPDDDYGRADAPTRLPASTRIGGRLIFVGANDGMIHAIDARTGYEVWAFIPYNLLPKLRRSATARRSISSITSSTARRRSRKSRSARRGSSLLLIGEGPGGTFYQTFDVTEAGMGVDPEADDLSAVSSMLSHSIRPNESIVFKWAFPNYAASIRPTARPLL